ncbi:MAG: FixH family protein [Hyphomicrobiales bacterium]
MISSKPKEFTGKHMIALVCAFFGTIIAVNLVLAYFAIGTWTGLVVPNSYVASQEYNAKLEDGRRMKELGWTANLKATAKSIELELFGKSGDALAGADVRALIKRPTHEAKDRAVQLVESQPGVYVAAEKLLPGAWDIDVTATDTRKRQIRRIFSVVIPEAG